MQIFIIGTALETAKELDGRRLNKQIIECDQIIKTISGKSCNWSNHPIMNMYRDHLKWIRYYKMCLLSYKRYLSAGEGSEYSKEQYRAAERYSFKATCYAPSFQTKDYFNQMKRRLYTKNPVFYEKWKKYGTSDVNWYFVDGGWVKYSDGKKVK